MRIDNEVKLDFDDVLVRPKRSTLSTRADVTLEREFSFPHAKHKWTGIPVVASNVNVIGTLKVAEVLSRFKMLTMLRKTYTVDDIVNADVSTKVMENIVLTAGTSEADLRRIDEIMTELPDINKICLDVANGYTTMFSNYVKSVRSQYPDLIIFAGATATAEMTEQLIIDGADAVRVGIGPGSVCTTRKVAGVGYPQLSAIIESADAAHGIWGHVMSDGGCRVPGDVVKAFAGGADFVILGGMFAGHEETGSDYYGMASHTAMRENYGGTPDYRAAEGKHVKIPPRGKLENTVKEILGGLRSACTYVGADRLKHLTRRTTFIRVNRQRNTVFDEYDV